jgi:HD-GYP domain-containing protein (c-di-GMP phosphodiesterase class II)
MCAFTTRVFDRFVHRDELNINEITEKVKEFIQVIKTQRKYILRIPDLETKDFGYTVTHSVKAAIISLIVADTLRLPPFKQIDVGTAALMHEIGMLKIPPNMYMNNKQLNSQQRKAIAAHTVLGFRILQNAQFSMGITRVALEHHENVDGSGYPRNVTGDKISLYAKIVSVSCAYVAMTSGRPHRNRSDGHTAILELLKNTGKQYDEQVIRALIFALSIYPLGTYVLLSDEKKAVVVGTDPEKPRHPLVRVLVDEQGKLLRNPPLLQLKKENGLRITRPLNNSEIEEMQVSA